MNDGIKTGLLAGAEDFKSRTIPLDPQQRPLSGEVHLWFLDLGVLSNSLRAALGAPQEDHPTVTAGQLLIARRFYLRLLLGAYLGLPGKEVKINRKNRGKPVLDTSIHKEEIHFSMAKSEDKLLIGISASSHIGVDLEHATRQAQNAMGVAQRYFSPAEAAALAELDPQFLQSAFLRVWASKEAVVKASGMGIANQFDRFTVDTDISSPAAVLDFDGGGPGDWSLALVKPADNFLGAVAIENKMLVLKTFRLLPVEHRPG
jgi:4'-phosphopantetheinyl transferase